MLRDTIQNLELPSGEKPLPLGSGYIASLLGSGAMANVYKIWNPQLETFRAVKLMKPDISLESKQRFQTEMKIMAALSHPNIIEIHSVGEWNGLSFIEMEYIEGYTLAEIIEKKGALPVAACSAIGIMISRALTYAHNSDYVLFGKSYHGIIHRDLKPSNLMLSKDGRVKLMDFGIARPVETSLMTLDGAVMGTMQYLAPEQIDGKNVGVAADIYALGAVSYEMLTGCKAFPQKNLSQLMAAKTENSFVPLRSFRIAIPPRFKTLVVSCMEHDPRKRVSSTAAALQDLENVHRRLTSDAPEEIVRALMRSSLRDRTVLTARKPFPVRMVAAVCGVVIAAIAASFLVVSSSKNERMPPPSAATQAREAAVGAFPKSVERTDSAKQSAARSLKLREKPASSKLPSAPAGKAKQVDEPKAQPVASTPVTFEMFEKEVESGNFENALQLFRKVPKEAAEQKNAQLLLLRALYGLGRVAEAGALITTHNIDDGEFYLIKAKYLVRRGDCDQSMNLLEKSLAVHARYLDADVIRRDYLYCRATCLSRRFDQNPSLENRKTALDAWFEVKNAVRRFPSHQYFGDAVAEMQRIGDLAKSSSPEKKEAMQ